MVILRGEESSSLLTGFRSLKDRDDMVVGSRPQFTACELEVALFEFKVSVTSILRRNPLELDVCNAKESRRPGENQGFEMYVVSI